jgi:hypothetical protein
VRGHRAEAVTRGLGSISFISLALLGAFTITSNFIAGAAATGGNVGSPAAADPTDDGHALEAPLDIGRSAPALGRAVTMDPVHDDGETRQPLVVTAHGTTVTSNLAAGGATWEWTDSTGIQYLNNYDMGRELQASFFVRTADNRLLNPTEAGDRFSDPTFPKEKRHRSLVAESRVDGDRQSTLSIPLEWSPQRIDPQAGTARPVIYPEMRLGKDLQLAYQGRPNVARYDTIVTLPAPATAGALEAPTAYLRAAFSNLFAFDAGTAVLTPLKPAPSSHAGIDWTPPSGFGALIASNAAGNHAFAIYAVTTGQGGSITRFTAHDFHGEGTPTGAGDVGTIKIRALRVGDFNAGTTRTTAYIVTGTLASVQLELASLAKAGVK